MSSARAFTIPSRLARSTKTATSIQQTRSQVLSLYRSWYRSTPEIIQLYGLSISPATIRAAIRSKFEANRHVTDPKLVNVLLLKDRQEYQETMNVWKQTDQIYANLLGTDGGKKVEGGFLEKFYQGRDEAAVRPAATGL